MAVVLREVATVSADRTQSARRVTREEPTRSMGKR